MPWESWRLRLKSQKRQKNIRWFISTCPSRGEYSYLILIIGCRYPVELLKKHKSWLRQHLYLKNKNLNILSDQHCLSSFKDTSNRRAISQKWEEQIRPTCWKNSSEFLIISSCISQESLSVELVRQNCSTFSSWWTLIIPSMSRPCEQTSLWKHDEYPAYLVDGLD